MAELDAWGGGDRGGSGGRFLTGGLAEGGIKCEATEDTAEAAAVVASTAAESVAAELLDAAADELDAFWGPIGKGGFVALISLLQFVKFSIHTLINYTILLIKCQ